MARKRTDLAAAKQRKQKIAAIVGLVVLAAVLAIQVPRMMRMLDSGEQAPPPAPAAAEPGTAGDAAPGTQATAAPTAAASGELVDSDAAPEPDEGDLATFDRFSSKDPFVQQIADASATGGPTDPMAAAATQEVVGSDPAGGSSLTPGGDASTSEGSSTVEPVATATAEMAVNGKSEKVTAGAAFPKADPIFKLVSVSGDSARIGIAGGGRFTSGAKAMTLKKGRPLTLVDTESGTRYTVILLSVG